MAKIVMRTNFLICEIHFYGNAPDKEREGGDRISPLLPPQQSIQQQCSLADPPQMPLGQALFSYLFSL